MRVLFLGTGTSQGIPMIGCDCPVCRSQNPKNRRTRCSVLISSGGFNLLIDTANELRLQAVTYGVERVDAILYTHAHADHVLGLDDLRPLNHRLGGPIPIYGSPETLERLRRMFPYAFDHKHPPWVLPGVEPHPIAGPFDVGPLRVVPVPVLHGRLPILGYRLGPVAYLTDVSEIPGPSSQLLRGLDLLILGALRHRPHPSHFTVAQAVTIVRGLRPRRALFTHICHDLEHEATNRALPSGIELAYDGLEVTIGDE